MSVPSKQIGQSSQANLLWYIAKQFERFTTLVAKLVARIQNLFVNNSFTGIQVLTQAEYDAIAVKDPMVIYFIKS